MPLLLTERKSADSLIGNTAALQAHEWIVAIKMCGSANYSNPRGVSSGQLTTVTLRLSSQLASEKQLMSSKMIHYMAMATGSIQSEDGERKESRAKRLEGNGILTGTERSRM